MLESPRPGEEPPPIPEAEAMQARQLFAYYGLLFLFLLLVRSFLIELNAQFDLAIFPKMTEAVRQVLDSAAEFDNALNILFSLLYAFLFSLPVAIVYRVTKADGQFDPSLGQTIVLLAMVVTAVMVVISGDLARAFGLAGVVAAVRFRNTLDDAKDAVYVFLAIAIGMACGSRAYSIAVWTSLVMTTTLYLMWRYRFGQLPGRIIGSQERGKKKKDGKEKKDKKDKKEKEPNSALIVEARDLARAQGHVENTLAAAGGKWRLASTLAHASGGGALEFVGRLDKTETSSSLLERVLGGEATAFIARADIRSLKVPRAPEPAKAAPEPESLA